MSNLPDNIDPNDPDAPWNEQTETILIEAVISKWFDVKKDRDDDYIEELRSSIYKDLEEDLKHTEYEIETIYIAE